MNSTLNLDHPKRLVVSTARPLTQDVEYFAETQREIYIRNNSSEKVLVESITLRFQSDAEIASIYEDHPCCIEIEPEQMKDEVIAIQPTPLYLASTNQFDVMVTYQVFTHATWSDPQSEIHRGSAFLIVKTPAHHLGQIFLSFKQPEDLPRARMLKRFADRAGFLSYLALADPQTGTFLWDKIEIAINASVAVFVIWSKRTRWGTGVEREIGIARKYHLPVVLLLESGVALPEWFDEKVEYQPFDPDNPSPSFVDAVTAYRKILTDIA